MEKIYHANITIFKVSVTHETVICISTKISEVFAVSEVRNGDMVTLQGDSSQVDIDRE